MTTIEASDASSPVQPARPALRLIRGGGPPAKRQRLDPRLLAPSISAAELAAIEVCSYATAWRRIRKMLRVAPAPGRPERVSWAALMRYQDLHPDTSGPFASLPAGEVTTPAEAASLAASTVVPAPAGPPRRPTGG